jgi:hypothetical protein
MNKWQRINALAFFLLAVFAAVKAVGIGFGTFKSPGAGFFPFWLAVLMAAVAIVYYAGYRGVDEGAQEGKLWRWRRPAMAAAVMLLFVQAMEYLGFGTATLFLFVAWLRGVEKQRWLKTALVAAIGTVSVYVLFAVLLQLTLPRGLLI